MTRTHVCDVGIMLIHVATKLVANIFVGGVTKPRISMLPHVRNRPGYSFRIKFNFVSSVIHQGHWQAHIPYIGVDLPTPLGFRTGGFQRLNSIMSAHGKQGWTSIMKVRIKCFYDYF